MKYLFSPWSVLYLPGTLSFQWNTRTWNEYQIRFSSNQLQLWSREHMYEHRVDRVDDGDKTQLILIELLPKVPGQARCRVETLQKLTHTRSHHTSNPNFLKFRTQENSFSPEALEGEILKLELICPRGDKRKPCGWMWVVVRGGGAVILSPPFCAEVIMFTLAALVSVCVCGRKALFRRGSARASYGTITRINDEIPW